MRISHILIAVFFLALPRPASSTPQFSRQYRVDCSRCHVIPPMLNRQGEDFLARGYRFETETGFETLPLAVWNTGEIEYRSSSAVTKAFPSRVELISSGPFAGRGYYFVELRALSQQIGGGGRLLDRSGRFEDLFAGWTFGESGGAALSVGQFRALSQVDVSRRLGISEPLAFSGSVPGRSSLAGARLTGLRGFSPAGRQPALRLAYTAGAAGRRPSDGWQTAVTVPLTGELTIPFVEGASFELEARPKGVFLETFHRSGLSSAGGHLFVGDRRSLAHVVLTHALGTRMFVTGAAGYQRAGGATRGRYSIGGDVLLTPRVAAGGRVDHLTAAQQRAAVFVYMNAHVPFGSASFRQAVRLQLEQRIQPRDHRTTLALSHLF